MRELLEKDRTITIVPHDFRNVNRGRITDIVQDGFTVELEYEPEGFLRNNFCEFYTQNRYGTLFFNSYPKEINGKTLKIADPAKHKFLQRRQYTRVKFIQDVEMCAEGKTYQIKALDVSAGGMRFTTKAHIDIEQEYSLTLRLSAGQSVEMAFSPVRIEKANIQSGHERYIVSGRFVFGSSIDKMTISQYCAQRSIEIRNK